jgi:hypothetical protein
MSKRNRGRADRERRARARRQAAGNTAKPPVLPVTEASQRLVAALTAAGLPALAERARRLEFDDNYSDHAAPMRALVAELLLADQPDLIERVKAGDFDATKADMDAYYSTPRGRAEKEAADREWAALGPDVRERFEEAMTALAGNPKATQRYLAEATAKMADELGLTEPAPDDDRIVSPDEVHPSLHPFLGQRGPMGVRLDTPEVLACAELVGRARGVGFRLTHNADDPADAGWGAIAYFNGGITIEVDDQPGPNAAARELAGRVLGGGQCQGCQRLVTLDPRGAYAADRTLLGGRVWTAAEQAAVGVCVWRRRGLRWEMGCKGPAA